MTRVAVSVAVLALTVTTTTATTVAASSPALLGAGAATIREFAVPHGHELPNPRAEKQRDLKTVAQELVLRGKRVAHGHNQVVRLRKGQFVELATTQEDSILTILGEFGTAAADHAHGSHAGAPGPTHNQIPEPDRTVDNATIWFPDFSPAHYRELLFSEAPGKTTMRSYYREQSSNRFTVNGDVTNWVQVPYNAASYGSNYCGHIICEDTWLFVNDSADSWYTSQRAAKQSRAAVRRYLARFDVHDRYDADGDGNFDEPDGYIDHFQSVHSGVGEEFDGGFFAGTDPIWSHRGYANYRADGPDGPGPRGFGGVQIGDTGYWIGDYTIEPENGGLGVFAHEFGHDLNLPDLYDTSGNTGGASNSTGFWTLMSFGSYASSGRAEDGIGSRPTHMGNWEKLQLGWLDYTVIEPGESRQLSLGPAEFTTENPQGAIVLLPDLEVPLVLGAAYEGQRFYYSDAGNLIDHSMTKSVPVPVGSAALTAKVRFSIEEDWDYAYLTVNGASVPTNLSRQTNPNGQNFGNGITGSSGGAWVDLLADLSAYAGQTVQLGFRYWTDGAVVETGFEVDAIRLGGTSIGTAEAAEGWALDGFMTTNGNEVRTYFHAYVLENKQYLGYDDVLATGPFNFGFKEFNLTERFPYQRGLLVNYWNTQFGDNSVGDHPGGGLVLPVDAHPQLDHWPGGYLMWGGIQSYDSTFGLWPVPSITLHSNGVPTKLSARAAQPVFDDSLSYWTNCDRHGCTGSHRGLIQPGWLSVQTPQTGTRIEVVGSSQSGTVLQLDIN
ncbi:MAG TPA: immune inhibitor A domain-containing protein [Nocardioidaceae bacterium]|nr:immune inhibitor A domain-containing protein [Nocardioidaceae bacterium]